MRYQIATLAVALTLCATTVARADGGNEKDEGHRQGESSVQLGPRPFWTLERSGILADGNNGFYYQTVDAAIKRDGDLYKVLDVLAKDVGILGVFSDWAAPVTFYANCMGLK